MDREHPGTRPVNRRIRQVEKPGFSGHPSQRRQGCAARHPPAVAAAHSDQDCAPEGWLTDRLDGFTDRLMQELPGLHEHGCCSGEPGGFLRRLRDGTWLGHVAEHVAPELQSRAGTPVTRGKTRSVRRA